MLRVTQLSKKFLLFYGTEDPGGSVSMVSTYTGLPGFDPGGKGFFSSLCIQTGSGAHPVSYPMGTGGPLPRANRGRGMMLTTHPHLLKRSRMKRSYTSSPHWFIRGIAGQLRFYFMESESSVLLTREAATGPSSVHILHPVSLRSVLIISSILS
jgi:hypothetical protein